MDYIIIIETTHDVNDGIGTADVAEKLVSKPFARAGALDQAGNVNECNGCRLGLLRVDDGRQLVHAGVRNLYDTDVRVDCAKGVVGRFGTGRSQGIEDG